MCIVCLDWQKGKLTSKEALRNLGELINTDTDKKDHYWRVLDQIMESELPVMEADSDLDKAYWDETHKND